MKRFLALYTQNERRIILNKKEENRIKSAVKSSSLLFYDEGIRICRSSVDDEIKNNLRYCSPTTQRLLEILMSSSCYKRRFFLDKINRESSRVISKISQDCSDNYAAVNDIVIRTVLGAVEHMPFRALTYLLPAVKMAEAFLEHQKTMRVEHLYLPQIEFIIMLDIGVSLNGLKYDKCFKEASLFIEIAKVYLDTYHPEVSSSVKFLVDESFSSNIRKNKEYQDYESKIKTLLKEDKVVSPILNMMGARRGHSDNSFEYAAMHPLLHDGLIDSNIASFTEYGGTKYSTNKDVSIIISIGARPEEEFWKVRKLAHEDFELLTFVKPVSVIQYITQMNVPPYSPLNTGELYLDDVIHKPELILQARPKKYNEWSEYQIPVQKSIGMLTNDTYEDVEELIEFLNNFEA